MMVTPPERLDPRGCPVPDRPIVIDGVERDRCPWAGDLAVTGKTLLVSQGPSAALRNTLLLFASLQRADGSIPASPLFGGSLTLIDYPAYWVESVHDYVLYSGDLDLARRVLPNVIRLVDGWYPTLVRDGLVANPFGRADYAFVKRLSPLVAYYNAQYVRALRLARELAAWAGQPAAGADWDARADAVADRVRAVFWDASAGAFKDGPVGPVVHPQDGNAFAVLAGIASPAEARSALAYLAARNRRDYGNTIADVSVWDIPDIWGTHASERVYPFIGFFEAAARFETGLDGSALDLLRRGWGYFLKAGYETTWEAIGPFGGAHHGERTSFAHGWSTGAAFALTRYVLGLRPTSPGFATFVVEPHAGDLAWARGVVPTPRGEISVAWRLGPAGRVAVTVRSPPGIRWERPTR